MVCVFYCCLEFHQTIIPKLIYVPKASFKLLLYWCDANGWDVPCECGGREAWGNALFGIHRIVGGVSNSQGPWIGLFRKLHLTLWGEGMPLGYSNYVAGTLLRVWLFILHIMTNLGIIGPILKMRKLRLCEVSDLPNNCNGYLKIWRSTNINEKILNKFVDKLMIMTTNTRMDGYIKDFFKLLKISEIIRS